MLKYKIDNPEVHWRKLCNELNADYNRDKVTNYAKQFADQLKIDIEMLEKNEPVSDCGLNAPRRQSALDKKCGIAREIVYNLYNLNENSEEKQRVWGYVRYTQIISKLRKAFVNYIEEKDRQEKQAKSAILRDRELYNTLANAEVSKSIISPSAMPVEVAPFDELNDFLEHMKKNVPVIGEDYIKFTRGAYYNDGRIDMCKQVVGPNWIGALMESIKNNEHVKHFLLGNNIVDIVGATEIANFIKGNNKPKIETWYIAGNSINGEGCSLIVDAIKTDINAKSLWLKRNPIGVDGVSAVARMLEENSTLECLDLHNTGGGDKGIELLFKSLEKNNGLRILYLGANGITKVGARHIADYFQYCVDNNKEGIDSLWLDMNRMEDDGVIMIANALKNYKSLKRISFGSNRITHIAAKSVCNALIDHPNLIMLDFGMYKATSDMGEVPNDLRDEGAEVIADFIKNNKYLKVLNITQNAITNEGMKKIVDAYQNNDSLLYIYYDQYGSNMESIIKRELKNCMERNIEKQLGISFREFHADNLRKLRHTENIVKIDSIYRNNM